MDLKDIGVKRLDLRFDEDVYRDLLAVQGDTQTRGYEFMALSESGEAIDLPNLECRLFGVNSNYPDKTVYTIGEYLGNGKYRVMLSTDMVSKAGRLKLQVALYQGTTALIQSKTWVIEVTESLANGGSLGTDLVVDFTRLAEAIVRVETLESDYTASLAEQSQIQSDVTIKHSEVTTMHTSLQGVFDTEAARVAAEQVRATAESERVTAEQGRTTAESGRVTAEATRETAEDTRATNEADRKIKEIERQTAESSRVTAESDRVTAEQGRVTAESARVSAETARETAEGTRETNESTRIANDAAREALLAEFQTAIDQGGLVDGTTFTPSVSAEGVISWTNNGNLANPSPVDIKGPQGVTFTPSVDASSNLSWTNDGGLANPTPRNVRGAIGPQGPEGPQGVQGPKGDTGPEGPQGVAGSTGPAGQGLVNVAGGADIIKIWTGTQAAYDALTPSADTLYIVNG